jgi:hypothetical protein
VGGDAGEVDELEDGGMQRIGELGDGAVGAVAGKDILGEVVGADAEEIDVGRKR